MTGQEAAITVMMSRTKSKESLKKLYNWKKNNLSFILANDINFTCPTNIPKSSVMNCSIILNSRLSNGVNFEGIILNRWGSHNYAMNISINQTTTIIAIQVGYVCDAFETLSIPNFGFSQTLTINSSLVFLNENQIFN